MDRRAFLKGIVATAAGVWVPGQVLAEPERRVWALDRTMMRVPYLETGFTHTDFIGFDRIPISMTFRGDAGYDLVVPAVLQPNGHYTFDMPPGYGKPESCQFLVRPSTPWAFTISIPQ